MPLNHFQLAYFYILVCFLTFLEISVMKVFLLKLLLLKCYYTVSQYLTLKPNINPMNIYQGLVYRAIFTFKAGL